MRRWAPVVVIALAGCGRIAFDPLGVDLGVQGTGSRVAAGTSHTCALRSDGVWCWGLSREYEIGNDSRVAHSTPVKIDAFASAEIEAIYAGSYSSCAIDRAGAVWCWGSNTYGELGQGTTTVESVPVRVDTLPTRALSVSIGERHACAVLDDASVWCWGGNGDAQVGRPMSTTPELPTRILDRVAAVSAGGYHTCVLRTDRTVWCWGASFLGQLGTGQEPKRAEPRQVPNVTANAITSGPLHTCVIVDGGRFRCWGANSQGELGEVATESVHFEPTPPSTTAGLVNLVSGSGHGCALTDEARVV